MIKRLAIQYIQVSIHILIFKIEMPYILQISKKNDERTDTQISNRYKKTLYPFRRSFVLYINTHFLKTLYLNETTDCHIYLFRDILKLTTMKIFKDIHNKTFENIIIKILMKSCDKKLSYSYKKLIKLENK